MNFFIRLVIVFNLLTLGACSTWEGFKEDSKKAGKAIGEAAENTGKAIKDAAE